MYALFNFYPNMQAGNVLIDQMFMHVSRGNYSCYANTLIKESI